LRHAVQNGQLPHLTDPLSIKAMLDTLMARDWVVYSKPCLTHTDTVVAYLARYSHRIALTDGRIRTLGGDRVQIDYKDYRDGNRHKILTLSPEELLRRFLLHVLPKGFMRIRHFGFLANRCRRQRLEAIRSAIRAAPPAEARAEGDRHEPFDGYPCPHCPKGRLQVTAFLVPKRRDGG